MLSGISAAQWSFGERAGRMLVSQTAIGAGRPAECEVGWEDGWEDWEINIKEDPGSHGQGLVKRMVT